MKHLDIIPVITPVPEKEKSISIKKKVFTMDEVKKHDKESDCWIVVNGEVIDATSFLNKHPGGKQVLLLWAGKDASTEFNMFHKKDAIMKYAPEIILGNIIQTKL